MTDLGYSDFAWADVILAERVELQIEMGGASKSKSAQPQTAR